MMARSEDRHEDPTAGLKSAVLPALTIPLGIVALFGVAGTAVALSSLIATKTSTGIWAWQILCVIAVNLLIGAGAIWGLLSLKPARLKSTVLAVLLGVVALFGLSGIAGLLKIMLAAKSFWGPWGWQTKFFLAQNLFFGVGAIWGWLKLKPWRGWRDLDEPISPATRRSRRFIELMNLIVLPGTLVLFFGSVSMEHPFAMFTNSPVPLWVAIVAMTCWLLARVLREFWHYNTDEHEQRAIDFGRRVGAGVFFAVTPAWWIAARGGILPQPNAMILWLLTIGIVSISWLWHRSR